MDVAGLHVISFLIGRKRLVLVRDLDLPGYGNILHFYTINKLN